MDHPNQDSPQEQYPETETGSGENTHQLPEGYHLSAAEIPERLGRYEVRSRLGKGGFSHVFLAHDADLDRLVALKVPRVDRFRSSNSLEDFLSEAKMAARLRHPGIVTVFDVGTEESFPYIVLEYVRGRTLSQFMRQETYTYADAAEIICAVADAMSHAHTEGFIHRDLKPSNILLDNDDRPHVADFGLALRHRDVNNISTKLVGTPHYMAPEQATGENHRIDERTDIFAVGIIFYELLSGKRPFGGGTQHELFERIISGDFVPPRELDRDIPAELERICTRCLSRRMSERYRRATELQSDLSSWLQLNQSGSGSAVHSSWGRKTIAAVRSDAPIVPRGLRAFGRDDADFFLRLLPGPRDRDGLPVTLRFWKRAIEQEDPEQSFRVGLLYGPSGCGKSSLVRAGLLPRLDDSITAIYLDAPASGLQQRIQRALRRKFKKLPRETDLATMLFELRERDLLGQNEKVLLVIDQFEQWLSGGHAAPDNELVQALRQCDGGKIQCLLLIRDDFWLPVSRFMNLLEIGIVDGKNAMLIDSFDVDHARSVLREIGVAHGCLPEQHRDITSAQEEFLARSVEELAEDGRLYPVRLSVFAEMVRGQPWEPATLEHLGGTEGIGVAFLDQAVGQKASSSRRAHTQAARHVLAALLPARGLIKDKAVRRSELLKASGYENKEGDFDQLMQLLESDLRLLTPILSDDPDSQSSDGSSPSSGQLESGYQLTHDFLVPSIREWLERDLRSTRGGRLQLMLRDQAELWYSRPSSRFLPSAAEWFQYQLRTERRDWTDAERGMMDAGRKHLLRRGTMALATLALVAIVGLLAFGHSRERQRKAHAGFLFSALGEVAIEDVPQLLRDMDPLQQYIQPLSAQLIEDQTQPRSKRLRAALARLRINGQDVDRVVDWIVDQQTPARDFLVARAALGPHADQASQRLGAILQGNTYDAHERFRTACALAGLRPERTSWDGLHEEVAATLLQQPSTDAAIWIKALQPLSQQLLPSVKQLSQQTSNLDAARVGVAAIEAYCDDDLAPVLELLPTANAPQFRAVIESLRPQTHEALHWLRKELSTIETNAVRNQPTSQLAQRANLSLAALVLGDIQPALRMTSRQADPRLRTFFVSIMTPERMDVGQLHGLAYENVGDSDLLGTLLLAAGQYLEAPLSQHQKRRWNDFLKQCYETMPSAEIHSASGLLLRRSGEDTEPIDHRLAGQPRAANLTWYFDPIVGQTMIVMRPGANTNSPNQTPAQPFAISATEVPVALFQRSKPNLRPTAGMRVNQQDTPVTEALIWDMAVYCNWLSREANLDLQQWCYPPDEEMSVDRCLPHKDFMKRSGYRLPTIDEYRFACRAGGEIGWLQDADDSIALDYCWSRRNGEMRLQRVGQLLPSPTGLFDVYGNASETCLVQSAVETENQSEAFRIVGGSVLGTIRFVVSEASDKPARTNRKEAYAGFRVVRLLPE